MKKFMITLMAILLPFGLYAQRHQEVNWKNIIQQVTAEKEFKVDIRQVIPRVGQTVTPTSPYSIEVNNDMLISHLPYIGRATNIAYGGGEGLNFTAPIKGYETVLTRNNKLTLTFRAKSSDDSFTYTLIIFDNGNVSMTVQGINRESISFTGEIILPKK